MSSLAYLIRLLSLQIFNMSVLQLEALSHKLASNPAQFPLVAGVISSSYFFFGNLGGAFFGVVPAIQDIELPVGTKVALWKWSYDKAKVCSKFANI
jgi:hypothetical protein